LNMSGESRQPSLIPDFKGYGFSFSPFSRMLALGLQCIPYVVLRIIPSIHSFFRVFIIKVCWILSKAFSSLIERIRWFLSCLQFVCCITLIDFYKLNHPYIPDWNWIGHGELSFWCVVEFWLPVSCWEFLHLCSL
jgi:hypothetical protein